MTTLLIAARIYSAIFGGVALAAVLGIGLELAVIVGSSLAIMGGLWK